MGESFLEMTAQLGNRLLDVNVKEKFDTVLWVTLGFSAIGICFDFAKVYSLSVTGALSLLASGLYSWFWVGYRVKPSSLSRLLRLHLASLPCLFLALLSTVLAITRYAGTHLQAQSAALIGAVIGVLVTPWFARDQWRRAGEQLRSLVRQVQGSSVSSDAVQEYLLGGHKGREVLSKYSWIFGLIPIPVIGVSALGGARYTGYFVSAIAGFFLVWIAGVVLVRVFAQRSILGGREVAVVSARDCRPTE